MSEENKNVQENKDDKRKATSLQASSSTQTLTWIGSDLKSF